MIMKGEQALPRSFRRIGARYQQLIGIKGPTGAELVSVAPDENLQCVFPQQWPASVEVDGPQGTTAKDLLVVARRPSRPRRMVEKAHARDDR
jgi:hypothetical protein